MVVQVHINGGNWLFIIPYNIINKSDFSFWTLNSFCRYSWLYWFCSYSAKYWINWIISIRFVSILYRFNWWNRTPLIWTENEFQPEDLLRLYLKKRRSKQTNKHTPPPPKTNKLKAPKLSQNISQVITITCFIAPFHVDILVEDFFHNSKWHFFLPNSACFLI